MWEVQTSLNECRNLTHFKSEIDDEKNFFVKAKTFLALKSEIADMKKPFFLIKPFFFSKIETF